MKSIRSLRGGARIPVELAGSASARDRERPGPRHFLRSPTRSRGGNGGGRPESAPRPFSLRKSAVFRRSPLGLVKFARLVLLKRSPNTSSDRRDPSLARYPKRRAR